MYRSIAGYQKTTLMRLQVPVSARINGVLANTYVDVMDDYGAVWCNFKTYGGTEKISNDILTVEDTAQIVCWYNPNIKSNCRLKRMTDNAIFEIIGEPENLEMRNYELQIKIRRVKGGA